MLKSPSCDSESSDHNQSMAGVLGGHGIVSPRVTRLTTRMDKRALFRQYRYLICAILMEMSNPSFKVHVLCI